jgi:hypothetical protein
MSSDISFRDLIRRVRAGDAGACTELVRRYEPAIRVAVPVRLTDPALRRVLDTMDVCQSVLANFFARPALSQFEPDDPAQRHRRRGDRRRHVTPRGSTTQCCRCRRCSRTS